MPSIDSLPTCLDTPAWAALCSVARLAPAITMLPPLQGVAIPAQVKAIAALGIALVLAPLAGHHTLDLPKSSVDAAIAIGIEAIFGVLLGTSALIVVTSLQLGGQWLQGLSPIADAAASDSLSDETSSALERCMSLLAMVLFLLLGGHRMLMSTVLDSWIAFPPGSLAYSANWLSQLNDLIAQALSFGLRAVLPVAFTMLASQLATQWLARALPQWNGAALWSPLHSGLMLLALGCSVTTVAWVFQHELQRWRVSTSEWVSAPSNTLTIEAEPRSQEAPLP
ncbi:MAG: flagellar biosynthetic protein FliR [Pirellula sp.]